VTSVAPPRASIETLSPRRREVLEWLAKGLTNDEIAAVLQIAPGTVRVHVTSLLAHLEVANRTEAATRFVAWEARPSRVAVVLRRPAIAVMPLRSDDADPRAHGLARGLTEDLASLFARWCWFPVISTLSSVHARTLGTSVEQIGVALGARFLVDGDVRPTSAGVRVSLHIDDAESGTQIWADRRELPWTMLHAHQDALCADAVGAAYPMLIARVTARPTVGVEASAWELAHEGMRLREQRELHANAKALACFESALERDPSMLLARYGAGLASYDAVLNQWRPKREALESLHEASMRCVEMAPHAAEGYTLHGRYLQSVGGWTEAMAPLEAAIGNNPSFALAHATLSQCLQATGRIEESLERMRHAVRLGPRAFQAGLASLHFMLGEYSEALAAAEGALATTPRYAFARGLAAASAHYVGDRDRGEGHIRALRRENPEFGIESFRATFGKQVDAVDRFAEALASLDATG
jgi:TolB-like protein